MGKCSLFNDSLPPLPCPPQPNILITSPAGEGRASSLPPWILNNPWPSHVSPAVTQEGRGPGMWTRAESAAGSLTRQVPSSGVFRGEQLRWRILAQLLLPRGPALWNAEPLKYAVRRSTHVCGHRSPCSHTSAPATERAWWKQWLSPSLPSLGHGKESAGGNGYFKWPWPSTSSVDGTL